MLEDHLKPRVALWAHIAAGVCIGMLAATFITWRVAIIVIEAGAKEALATISRTADQSREASTKAMQAAAQAELTKRLRQAEAQRALEAARAQQEAEAEQRELAWTRYYRKSAACDEAKGGAWSVDCANEYIRARKRFAELYQAGKL